MKQLKKLIMYYFSGNRPQVEKFLRHKSTRSKETVRFYRSCLEQYIAFVGDQWPPTPELITDFIVHCQDKGLSTNTVHAYYRAVKVWCGWLHKNNVIDRNPIKDVEPPQRPRQKDTRAADPVSLKALIKHLENAVDEAYETDTLKQGWRDVRDLAIVSISLDTGLRVGEVERLKRQHIDLEKYRIFVPKTKSGEPRTVVFGDTAKDDLNLWLEVRSTLNISGDLPIFVSKKRGYWGSFTQWGIRQMLKKRCMKLGLKVIGPHSLRHSFASQSLRNGADLDHLMRQLGHASIETTAIYTRRTPDDLHDVHSKTSPRDNL